MNFMWNDLADEWNNLTWNDLTMDEMTGYLKG